MKSTFKVESGIQLLSRLSRKPVIEGVYPILFDDGPKPGEIIELFSETSTNYLLSDIISEILLPTASGRSGASVILLNTGGNIGYETLTEYLRAKILSRSDTDMNVEETMQSALENFFTIDVFDAGQLYITIQNLENILAEHVDTSMIVFDTLTSFYWSEQGFKLTKMDVYVKNLIRLIQKVTKEYKISILFTRPEYFSSCKDTIQNLEPCCEHPTLERINYRIQVVATDDVSKFQVNLRTFNKLCVKYFNVIKNGVQWCHTFK